jgi:hypothetical protein
VASVDSKIAKRAAPPKGHTHKLSGKRTGRVEEIALSGNFFALWRAAAASNDVSSPPKGRATDFFDPRNLSGTEDRGVTHRNRQPVCALRC